MNFKSKTLLIVDDEPELREILCDEFQGLGALVLTAENGRQAFEILKSQKVDVVLSDVRMPDGDGIELLDRIRSVSADTPVVAIISGFSDLSKAEIYHKGADSILSKPYDMPAIVAAVSKALEPHTKRWSERIDPFPGGYTLRISSESLDRAMSEGILNLGRGGMALKIKGPPPAIGTLFAFQLSSGALGGDGGNLAALSFEGKGICRWFRPSAHAKGTYDIGLEFVALTQEALKIY